MEVPKENFHYSAGVGVGEKYGETEVVKKKVQATSIPSDSDNIGCILHKESNSLDTESLIIDTNFSEVMTFPSWAQT